MPKYAPPPKPVEKKPEDDVDLREVDKPKNQILRLPKYIVQEDRPAVFRERDVNTKQGLSGLAMKRYITEADRALNRYTIPLFAGWSPGSGSATEERALAMYAEDERLQNIADLKADAATAKRAGDKAGADYISRNVNDTYMRRSDYGWQSSKGK